MDNTITKAIRSIVREELQAELGNRVHARSSTRTEVEMPLRPGEVERHYPVVEVARLLGMSREWVYQRINDGTFAIANFGTGTSKRRIPASSINAYLQARTHR